MRETGPIALIPAILPWSQRQDCRDGGSVDNLHNLPEIEVC